MSRRRGILTVLACMLLCLLGYCRPDASPTPRAAETAREAADSLRRARIDSIASDSLTRYSSLTEADFRQVADELGIEVAAMKAVVEIEAGKKMTGFWAPGVPVANFDLSMYNQAKRKVKTVRKAPASEKIPAGLTGAYARKEYGLLVKYRKINLDAANMGTFWGMFQIGGFNYRLCGCETVDEMVRLMSYSELEQLELFATFIVNTGMIKHLRRKDWAGFARQYNGARYASRGYHTRMARAYARYKNQQ